MCSVKGQTVNVSGPVSHRVSVTTTQLCQCQAEAATDAHKGMRVAVFQENFSYKNTRGIGFDSMP